MFTPPASAQLLPTPEPGDPTDPIDQILNDDDEDDGDDEGDEGDGGTDPIDAPGDDGPDSSEESEDTSSGDGSQGNKGDKGDKGAEDVPIWSGTGHIGGSFSTDGLALAAAKLRSLGMSEKEIIQNVYRPFIIAGPAGWTDTWGAPRFGPGAIVRTHEGQDVFCRYGDPVLAPEPGIVSYSDSGLGGISARVHTSSSSYYYLTHLSATNAEQYPSGSLVAPGDVVGFCGNTGNAITTPPHVHFGWYVDGVAKNPMRRLIKWLNVAELRVLGHLSKHEARAIRQTDTRTLERLYGDAFAPDRSALDPSDESLLTIGTVSPTMGAFAALGQALQQAYAQGTFSLAWMAGDSPLAAPDH
jgi:hypothetical protein